MKTYSFDVYRGDDLIDTISVEADSPKEAEQFAHECWKIFHEYDTRPVELLQHAEACELEPTIDAIIYFRAAEKEKLYLRLRKTDSGYKYFCASLDSQDYYVGTIEWDKIKKVMPKFDFDLWHTAVDLALIKCGFLGGLMDVNYVKPLRIGFDVAEVQKLDKLEAKLLPPELNEPVEKEFEVKIVETRELTITVRDYTREAAQLRIQGAYDNAFISLNESAPKSTDFSVIAEKEIAYNEPSREDDEWGER